MRALLTVAHHDAASESYALECPHGRTEAEPEADADAAASEPRPKLVAGLLARHGLPFGCTCAAETDLADIYPSIDSAIEQITAGAGNGVTDLDDELIEGLVRLVREARCPTCEISVKVLPLHLPLVVIPIHDLQCPRAAADGEE